MFGLTTKTINNTNRQHVTADDSSQSNKKLTIKEVNNSLALASEYAEICLKNKVKNKWIMFINPEESAISQLASFENIDQKNVLCVQIKADTLNRKEVFSQIKRTLLAENCSALILPKSLSQLINSEELSLEFNQNQANGYILANKNIAH